MLAEQVKAGTLPKLAERIPTDPLVIEPLKESGQYGGEWHTALLGPADTPWLARTIGYDPLVRWTPDFTRVMPNIASSVEPSDGGRTWTIKLREGTKWSDGQPYTADDLVFIYNEILQNTDLFPEMPSQFVVGGEPATMEKVDELTVMLHFAAPSGRLSQQLAGPYFRGLAKFPPHYLKQFHIKYNPDATKQAKEAGFSTWSELFLDRTNAWVNPDLPSLCAWKIKEGVGQGQRVVAERNPYYCKVDAEGRQLPYLDRVVYEVISEVQTILLKASNGEFDMHTRHIIKPENKPVLARNRKKGNYHFIDYSSTSMNAMMINLNLTCQDGALAEMFRNRDFRIGLSHAINRDEIIKTVYLGQAKPWQGAPLGSSDYFNGNLATQYTEHDVAKANEYLDTAGLTERDDEGFRLRPDGQRLGFIVDVSADSTPMTEGLQLVKKYWKEVGVELTPRSMDRSLMTKRFQANEHEGQVWFGGGGGYDAIARPGLYFPFNVGLSRYAVGWATWYQTRGEEGEKPPQAARDQMDLYDQILGTPDIDKQRRLFMQILDIAQKQFWVMGTCTRPELFGVVRNDFHNVPESIIGGQPVPGQTRPEQYFTTQSS